MPVAELVKLLPVDLLGQIPQRILSLLREAQVTQGVNHPLPAVCHLLSLSGRGWVFRKRGGAIGDPLAAATSRSSTGAVSAAP